MGGGSLIKMDFKLFVAFAVLASACAEQVTVQQGALLGSVENLVTGDGTYYAFRGIPYAKPPLGDLRFKAPQPAQAWTGVKNATQYGAMCPQASSLDPSVKRGAEDCLFINVFTKNLKPAKPLPVIVYIYGGGFNTGSGNSDLYGPDFLVKDVVLVTFNYRLGPLGFLNLDTKDVPGNAGLKDQVLALKWVQANIKNFGGDPNQVTLMGESSGGEAVSLHMLSPMSKGLFKRIIDISGTVLNNWALPFEPVKRAYKLGEQLGKTTTDPKELLTFLQGVPAEKFIGVVPTLSKTEELVKSSLLKQTFDTYVVEKNLGGEHFLTEDPVSILKSGVVNNADYLIGHVKDESKVEAFLAPLSAVVDAYSKNEALLVPLRIFYNIPSEKSVELAKTIKKHYFGDKQIGNDTVFELISYLSDDTYKYDIQRFLRILPNPECNSRYLYNFNMMSDRNYFGNQATKATGHDGAGHSDDVFYLFDPKLLNLPISTTSTTYSLIKKHCALFTNFAKYGNPTPNAASGDSILGNIEWLQYDNETKAYLNIANELSAGNNLDADVIKFWDEIYKQAGLQF